MIAKMLAKRKLKVFPGWWTVIASGIISLWWSGVSVYGFAAYLKPIAADLGLSRAVMSGGGSLGRLEGGIEGPLAGWTTDKYGPRIVSLVGIFFGGLGLMLMYFINSTWSYYVAWGISSFGFNLGIILPLDAAMANWFIRKRGLAISVMRGMIGFSGITIVPLLTWFMGLYGWRITLVVAGLAMWAIGLPLARVFVKPHRPEYYGLLPDGEALDSADAGDAEAVIRAGVRYAERMEEVEFTLRQALRTPAFWIMVFANSLHGMVMPAVSMHQIPFLTDMGVDPVVAAAALGWMVLMSTPGRLLGGVLADRVSVRRLRFILAVAYSLQCLGLFVFLTKQSMTFIYLYLTLYGLGMGMAIGAGTPLRGRYFGRKGFATIGGAQNFLNMPVGIIAPVYAGWTYDTTGSYMSAFRLITILLVLSVITICFAFPPKPPAKVTEITNFI